MHELLQDGPWRHAENIFDAVDSSWRWLQADTRGALRCLVRIRLELARRDVVGVYQSQPHRNTWWPSRPDRRERLRSSLPSKSSARLGTRQLRPRQKSPG